MKKRKQRDAALLIILCAVLLFGSAATLLFPAPPFSERENRYLAKMPVLSRETLLGGTYAKGAEAYLSEHIPTRQAMLGLRALVELGLGKREVNGVLLCPDGRLIQKSAENPRAVRRNTQAIRNMEAMCLAKQLPCTVCILPQQESLSNLLTKGYTARPSDTDEALQTLLNERDYWYRTDHHMTTAGAYALYGYLGRLLDYTPHGVEDFSPVTVSEQFLGTADAAAGIPYIRPDSITLYRYGGDTDFSVTADGKALSLTGLYDMERLATRDGYGVFLGGNHGVTEISRGAEDTRPVLLIVKDSFANALLPFLARHYRLLVVDPRYTSPDLAALAEQADRVLVLCGEETLSGSFLEIR